jgi:hypothetical protein
MHGGEDKSIYRISVGKPDRKSPLGRPRHRWEKNIKMDLRGMRWIRLIIWLRMGTTVMNLWVPPNVGKFLNH